jgi:hypothetical protein
MAPPSYPVFPSTYLDHSFSFLGNLRKVGMALSFEEVSDGVAPDHW